MHFAALFCRRDFFQTFKKFLLQNSNSLSLQYIMAITKCNGWHTKVKLQKNGEKNNDDVHSYLFLDLIIVLRM